MTYCKPTNCLSRRFSTRYQVLRVLVICVMGTYSLLLPSQSQAQVNVVAGGFYGETFSSIFNDGSGIGTTPNGWMVRSSTTINTISPYSALSNTVQFTGAGQPTTEGRYVFGAPIGDNAIGGMSRGTLMIGVDLLNSGATGISSITVGATLEKYKTGTYASTYQTYYSLDGGNWTAYGNPVFISPDFSSATCTNPCTTMNAGGNVSAYVAPGAHIYLAWVFSQPTQDGFSVPNNYQAWGIDDIVITPAQTNLPTLSSPTAVPSTITATLGAAVNNNDPAPITSRGTVWDVNTNPTINALAEGGTTKAAFSHNRTGFNANTSYFYRGYAVNIRGTGYSSNATFTTLSNPPVSQAASNVVINGFRANWSAPAVQGSASYTYTVEIATNSGFTTGFQSVSVSSSTFFYDFTALPLTDYWYRVKVVNAGGSSAYSAVQTLQTPTSVNCSGTPASGTVNSSNGTSFCSGAVSSTLTLSSDYSTALGITYLWQQSTDGVNYSNAAGNNNSPFYSLPALTQSTYFKCTIACTVSGLSTTTDPIFITIDGVEIDVRGNGVSIADGDNASTVTDNTNFGNVRVSTSATNQFVIFNTGNLSLSVTGITITGTNSADFVLVSPPTFPLSIAPGNSQTINIQFTPALLGTRNATVNIASNDCNEATYDFAVSGTGVLPEINVTGNGLTIPDGNTATSTNDNTNLGSVVVNNSTTKQFVIANTGLLDLNVTAISFSGTNGTEFTLMSPATPFTVTTGGTQTITVQFSPLAIGTRTATINIVNNDANEANYDFVLTGAGTTPEIDVRGNTISIADGDITPSTADNTDYGIVQVNSTLSKQFVVHNTGTSSLNVSDINFSGLNSNEFTLVSPAVPFTVNSSASQAITVQLAPLATGVRTAVLNITSDDLDEAGYNITLQGTAAVPAAALSLDGSNDYVQLPHMFNPANSSFTVEGNVRVNNVTGTKYIFQQEDVSGTGRLLLGLDNGRPYTFFGGVANLYATTVLQTNTWYHLAVTWDGTNYSIYINGVLEATAPKIAESTLGGLKLGANKGASVTLDGTYDEVRVWSYARSQSDIQGSMNCEISAQCGLLAAYHFNQGFAGVDNTGINTLTDASGNSNTGTLTNFALNGSTSNWIEPGNITTGNSCTAGTAEINIIGNGLTIVDGDITSSTTDNTDAGSVLLGAGITKQFVIANTGSAALVVNSVSFAGAAASNFSLVSAPSFPLTITAGSSETITVLFVPSVTGLRAATISINNNDCNESLYDFALQGTGVTPEINVLGNGIAIADNKVTVNTLDNTDFGFVQVSNQVTKQFTIQNTGSGTLTVSSIVFTGIHNSEFTLVSPPAFPLSIAPAGSQTITVRFLPLVAGVRAAAISISNSDLDEGTYNFALQGAGSNPSEALAFDGVNNFVQLPFLFNPVATAFTIEGKVRFNSFSGTKYIFQQEDASGTGRTLLGLNGSQLNAFFGGTNLVGTTTLSTGTWYHVAVTWDGTSYSIYLDGNLEATATRTAESTLGGLKLGTNKAASVFLNAAYDEVRIWNYARSQADIQAVMNCEISAQCNLLAAYHFNQGLGGADNPGINTLIDASSNGRDGTLMNFALSGNSSNWIEPGAITSGTNCSLLLPVINIYGNNVSIPNLDVTPSLQDNTLFLSSENIPLTKDFEIRNTGSSSLVISTINITSQPFVASPEFTPVAPSSFPVSIAPGTSQVFTLQFLSSNPSVYPYTITIVSNDCQTASYSFTVKGTYNGAALSFDGLDDKVNVSGINLADKSFTIEFWERNFQNNDNDDFIAALGSSATTNNYLHIGYRANNNFTFAFWGNDLDIPVTRDVNWHHWACVYDTSIRTGSNRFIYRDGVLIAQDRTSSAFKGSGTFTVGNLPALSNSNYFGFIDELRIWTIARSQQAIQANMNCELNSQCGLEASYHFNQGIYLFNNSTETTLTDASGSNHNGSLQNFALQGGTSNWIAPGGVVTGSSCTPIFPMISVAGNNVTIANGDNTPSAADNTSFNSNGVLTASTQYTIQNTGNSNLSVTGISFSGGTASSFSLITPPVFPLVIAAGSNYSITVQVSGSGPGQKSTTLQIQSTDCTVPAYTFAITGTLTVQEITIEGNGVDIADGDLAPRTADNTDFGNIAVGNSDSRQFAIRNTGAFPLTITGISLSGTNATDFSIQTPTIFPVTIPVAGQLDLTLALMPTSSGSKWSTVIIANDDPNEGSFDFAIRGGIPEPGAALDFDGVNDRVTVASGISIPGSFTIEFWAKRSTTTSSTNDFVVARETTAFTNRRLTIGFKPTGEFSFSYSNSSLNASATYNDLLWHHWACVYQAGANNRYIYRDGILVAQDAAPGSLESFGAFTIGGNPAIVGGLDASEGMFNGQIDELRVWTVDRAAQQIMAYKDCEFALPQCGLLAQYHFNQGLARADNSNETSLTDAGGNGLYGTLSNFTLAQENSNWVAEGGVISGTSCSAPQITVKGNGVAIADGDNTPGPADSTDFGNIGISGSIRNYVISNAGTEDLTVTAITLSGTNAARFSFTTLPTFPLVLTQGQTRNLPVLFSPIDTFVNTAIINITHGIGCVYDFAINAKGLSEPGACLRFNGGFGKYVQTPSVSSGSFTFECWAKRSGSGTRDIFVSQSYTGSGRNFEFGFLPDNSISFSLNGFIDQLTVSGLSDNSWHHWACTFQNEVATIYRDGIQVGQKQFALFGGGINGGVLQIGRSYNSNTFNGDIDEVRYWQTVRTPAEIQADKNCEISGFRCYLALNYHFNQGFTFGDNSAITAVDDSSGNGNHGTIVDPFTGSASPVWVAPGGVVSGVTCTAASYPAIAVGYSGVNIPNNSYGTPSPGDARYLDTVKPGSAFVERSFVIHNTGSAGLSVTNIETTSFGFSIVNTPSYPFTVAPGDSVEFTVRFSISANNDYTSLVNIYSSDCQNSFYYFLVKAVVSYPEITVNGNSNFIFDGQTFINPDYNTGFGELLVGNSIEKEFVIINHGVRDLQISDINIAGSGQSQFTLIAPTTFPFAIAPSEDTTIRVRFSPTSAGIHNATIHILNDDPSEADFDFAIQGTAGVIASSLSFDGSDDKVSVPSGIQLANSSFTIEFWAKRNGSDRFDMVAGQGQVPNQNQVLHIGFRDNNNFTFAFFGNDLDVPGLSDNQWHHWACVYNSGITSTNNRFIYRDGILVASDLANGDFEGSGDFEIGRMPDLSGHSGYENLNGYNFNGNIDNLRVWRYALSQERITASMNCEINDQRCGLVVNYLFNQGLAGLNNQAENTLKDNSGNHFDGGLQGLALNGSTSNWVDDGGVTSGNICASFDPVLSVSGNANTISNADNTPDFADSTNFGNVHVGTNTTRQFVISNTGNATLEIGALYIDGSSQFSILNTPSLPLSIPAGNSVSVSILFEPQQPVVENAVVYVGTSGCQPDEFTFSIQGTGTLAEIIVQGNNISVPNGSAATFIANGTDFGTIESGQQQYVIQNPGNETLVINSIQISGTNAANFVLTDPVNFPVSVLPGGMRSITVRFTASFIGLHTATITINSNDESDPLYSFAVQATAPEPEINVLGNGSNITLGDGTPDAADNTYFGTVGNGVTETRDFVIQNPGAGTLVISDISFTGFGPNYFSVVGSTSFTVPPFGTHTITIAYNGVTSGQHKSLINISSNDVDVPVYYFVLAADGIIPAITVTGNNIDIADDDITPSASDGTDFGSVNAGNTQYRAFVVTNTGSENLVLSDISFTGTGSSSFSFYGSSPAFPIVLTPFQSYTLQMLFTPSTQGINTATVNIESNDPDNSLFDFAVKGIALSPEISVSGNGVPIAAGDLSPNIADNTNVGATATGVPITKDFVVENAGTGNLLIYNVSTTPGSAFSIAGNPSYPVTVAPGDSYTFTVQFMPTQVGVTNSFVAVSNNDLDENNYYFYLAGTGTSVSGEIDITGNGISIPDGNAVTSNADNTDFGNVLVNGNGFGVFVIHNSGTDPLYVSAVEFTGVNGSEFNWISGPTLPQTILPNSDLSFTVEFIPTGAGVRTATLHIISQDADESDYDFAIKGTGYVLSAGPDIDVKDGTDFVSINDGDDTPDLADHTDLGASAVGSENYQWYYVYNTGLQELSISGIYFDGVNSSEFSLPQDPQFPATVEPGGVYGVLVLFKASNVGVREATLHILSNDDDEPDFDFALKGTATCPLASSVTIASSDPSVCSSSYTFIEFAGTPHSIITYKVNNGNGQTIEVEDNGFANLYTGPLTVNTTYSLVSVSYPDYPSCNQVVTGSVTVTIAVSYTWTGFAGTVWSDPANWTACGVPPANADVTIPSTSNKPVLDKDIDLRNIDIQANATLTIGTNTLSINGAITGTGSFSGSSTSNMVIAGSAGTLNFTSGSQILKNLTLNTGAIASLGTPLAITAGSAFGTITVANGASLVSNGNLTLKSDAAGTSRVAESNGTITGDVTVERYLPATGRSWRLLTIPVTSSTKTVRDAWTGHAPNGNAPSGEVGGSGTLITGNVFTSAASATAAGFDWWPAISGASSSILRYVISGSNGSWPSSSSNSPVYVPGMKLNATDEGYMLFVRGDRTVTTGFGSTTLKPSGSLKMGTQTYSIPAPASAFYKVLGNPYASTISFEKLMANGANSTMVKGNRFWTWDAANGSLGGYRLINKISPGVWERIPTLLSESATSYGEYLQSGQAILVETIAPGANFTIDEQDKVVGPPAAYPTLFDIGNTGRFYVNLNLDNGASDLKLSDGVVATFDANGNNNIDVEDAKKIDNFNENISLVRNSKRLTLEARNLISSNSGNKDTLYFQMSNLTPRNYAFQFKGVQMQNGLTAKLQDLYLGKETVISTTGDITTVNFAVTADASSGAADRFRVVFKADPSLPLTLTSAKAYSLNNGVQVDWKTVNEKGVKNYEVEKSQDGRSFAKATSVTAQNGAANSYGWYDANPVRGNNYYRIKSIGTSGETGFSQVLVVNLSGGKSAFMIYPNPVKGNRITLQLSNMEKGKYAMTVYNAGGQRVISRDITHLGGSATEEIDLGSVLASGVYRVSFSSNNDRNLNQTLVVQR